MTTPAVIDTRAALRWIAIVLGLLAFMNAAMAHKPSDAYWRLAPIDTPTGAALDERIDIALRDLDRELGLDADEDRRLTWGEVRRRWSAIEQLAERDLRIAPVDARCQPGPWQAAALDEHSDGRYAVLQRRWQCAAAPGAWQLDYALFAASDPTHRGVVRWRAVEDNVEIDRVLVLGGERVSVRVSASGLPLPGTPDPAGGEAAAGSPGPQGFGGFLVEGVHHILIGADHVLFLLALLLPAVLRPSARDGRGSAPVAAVVAAEPHGVRAVLLDILKVVTAFTVAHSVTLSLAALDIVDPPSRWVESIIAASVVLAALDNLRARPIAGRWTIAFAFGLVHGFGFAGVLKDLGLGGGSVLAPLLGFNLGVELGQLLIVALFVPMAWWLRETRLYRVGLVRGGSVAIALLAAVWLAERALDLEILGA